MDFLSVRFMVLLAVTVFLTILVKKVKVQNLILLASSIVFYAMWDYRYLLLLFAEILLTYFVAVGIDKYRDSHISKILCGVGVAIPVLALSYCKYMNFFLKSLRLAFEGNDAFSIVAPLGISFYTFMIISYVVDVYRQKMQSRDLLSVALYVMFFPSIVSGSITKARDLIPQFENTRTINKNDIYEAMQIFVTGAFKKVVLADRLSVYVNVLYSNPDAYSGFSLFCGMIAYSMQLYFDFSGYSDMAIGVAKALGIDLAVNFNMPYLSKNPTEFWKRWHISLSAWIQEYLYISFGGNRKGKIRTYINLLLAMLIGGLWHGADWSFVAWGGLHGLALVIHKIYMEYVKKSESKAATVVSIIFTGLFASVCWVFFRAESISQAVNVLKRIICLSPGVTYVYIYFVIFFIIFVAMHIIIAAKYNSNCKYIMLDYDKFLPKLIICITVMLILTYGYFGNNVFIYQQF